MSDNMSDMMKNLSGMLNGKEIPDNVKNMLNSVMNNSNATDSNTKSNNIPNSNTENVDSNNSPSDTIDMETLLKMQQIFKAMNKEQSSSGTNLLRSLKPYLKPSRQKKVDQYIQLFNMGRIIETFNHNGGDKHDS